MLSKLTYSLSNIVFLYINTQHLQVYESNESWPVPWRHDIKQDPDFIKMMYLDILILNTRVNCVGKKQWGKDKGRRF